MIVKLVPMVANQRKQIIVGEVMIEQILFLTLSSMRTVSHSTVGATRKILGL